MEWKEISKKIDKWLRNFVKQEKVWDWKSPVWGLILVWTLGIFLVVSTGLVYSAVDLGLEEFINATSHIGMSLMTFWLVLVVRYILMFLWVFINIYFMKGAVRTVHILFLIGIWYNLPSIVIMSLCYYLLFLIVLIKEGGEKRG